jgi:adenosylhomocysteine nucleosidase
MSRIAIIAALERELHPLVEGWGRRSLDHAAITFSAFESGELVAVASGIGCRRAELAARAVMEEFQPQTLISVGMAGALIRSLKVGSIVTPNVIVDAATQAEYRCQAGGDVVGGGVLVSAEEITDSGAKARLAERFHALVVDMEAAGVAKVAQECNIGFRCVKAISDEFDFAMPPLNRFVDQEGTFHTGKFLAWSGIRPQYWLATVRLARNSGRATQALAAWLRKNVNHAIPQATVVTLNGAEHFKN